MQLAPRHHPTVTIFVVELMDFFFYLAKGGFPPTPRLAYRPEALLGVKDQKSKPTFAMT